MTAEPTREELLADALAWRYHYLCESFDAGCHPLARLSMQRNGAQVRDDCLRIGRQLHVSARAIHKAIRTCFPGPMEPTVERAEREYIAKRHLLERGL